MEITPKGIFAGRKDAEATAELQEIMRRHHSNKKDLRRHFEDHKMSYEGRAMRQLADDVTRSGPLELAGVGTIVEYYFLHNMKEPKDVAAVLALSANGVRLALKTSHVKVKGLLEPIAHCKAGDRVRFVAEPNDLAGATIGLYTLTPVLEGGCAAEELFLYVDGRGDEARKV
jgi:hypothetical protein